MVDIPHVEHESVLPRLPIAPVHLREPSQTGLHVMPTRLLFGEESHILHQKGPGSNKAHVAPQNIPQFRQLIQAESSQRCAERGQPVVIRQERSIGPSSVGHRPELREPKRPAMNTRPHLDEEHRSAGLAKDRHSYPSHHRCQGNHRHGCARDVDKALASACPSPVPRHSKIISRVHKALR